MHDQILGITESSVTCPPGYFGEPPSCSCFEDNTAYFWNNVQMSDRNLQPSRMACQQSCSDHSECEFWTWAKKTPEGPCYLKHTRENVSPGFNNYVSGSKQCLLPEANGKYIQFPLAAMGVLTPGSAHARPSAQSHIDTSGNFLAQVSGA